ncbi:MAG: copper homeostasis protein CutC [Acidobacteriota bacterium]|nr:copper homeostasis protein CutC [Acidobacteriota bacterium]
MKDALLEVIACTVEDALEAERGGADRLEIISRFDLGGLTPALELVREIKAKVSLPLRVMVRESEGYVVSGETEIKRLCAAAYAFKEIGVDGIVLGFLRRGEIDFELTQRILACAPTLKATFHHAFEDAADKFAVIAKLKALPQIDRILSHGGLTKNWAEKYSVLESYARAAQPEIEILAGGGVDREAINLLRKNTSVREFHTGSAARNGGQVDKSRVEELVRTLRGNYD